MADTAISGLTALTGANVDSAADLLEIDDVSVTTNKKITVAELFAVPTQTLVTPNIGAATGTSLVLSGAVTAATAAGAVVATQANQETGTATDLLVSPGRQHFHPSAAKAWGLVTHPTTVTVSYPSGATNTNTGTGVYVVTHGLTFSSANYAVVVTPVNAGFVSSFITARDATTFTVKFSDETGAKAVTAFSYECFGDL